jgi:anti-sigma B factor antagonist
MIRPTKFEIDHKRDGPALTVAIKGELDMSTVATLSERLDSQLKGEVTLVTVDLRDLTFMDSSGLRLLIELNYRSQAESWQLALVAPEAEAATIVLRMTGADTALPFQPSHER